MLDLPLYGSCIKGMSGGFIRYKVIKITQALVSFEYGNVLKQIKKSVYKGEYL